MGMCNEERQVRELLRAHKATLKRIRGHHEIWELPNGCCNTLVTGRVERRLWKNTLSQLRHNLSLVRGIHPSQSPGSSAGSGKFVLGPRGFVEAAQ